MRFYTFQVLVSNSLVAELCGEGENAMSAFETQISYGSYVPANQEFTVVATGPDGLSFKFECYKH